MTNTELLVYHSNTWNYLTVCKQNTDVELLVHHNNTWNFNCVQTNDWCWIVSISQQY